MRKHTLTIAITGLLGGAAAGVLAPRIYSAYASVPAGPAGQLWYAGALVQGAAPLTGSHTLQVALFADASGSTPLACSIPALGPVDLDLTAGRFRVDVSACASALQSATTAYVRVTLDPGQAGAQAFPPSGSILPQIGAVPYALEATRATTATSATTAGAASTAVPNSALDHLATGHVCGVTAATTGKLGASDGYRKAALACRNNVAGCSTANATICTSADVIRFLGNHGAAALPSDAKQSAWIATGTSGQANGGTANIFHDDCVAFTFEADTPYRGTSVALANSTNPGEFSNASCAGALPILCCDY